MRDIKKKQKSNKTIRKLETKLIYADKLKNNLVDIKNKTKENIKKEENNSTEYATNVIESEMKKITNNSIDNFNKYGRKAVTTSKEEISKIKSQIVNKRNASIKTNIHTNTKASTSTSKSINTTNNINNKIRKNIKNNISKIKNKRKPLTENKIKRVTKDTKKAIKTAETTAKNTAKATKQGAKIAKETAKQLYKISKITAKAIVKSSKVILKAMVKAIKAIIELTKALISFLVAGGWVAVIIILMVCVMALLFSSMFGIFFTSEQGVNDKTMSSIVQEINKDFSNKITEIQKNNIHDDFEIENNKAEWKDILSIYTVLQTKGEEQSNVILLDEDKEKELKNIFWNMNTIKSTVKDVEKEIEIIEDNGEIRKEIVKRKVLYISVTSKSLEEMIKEYNLNSKQKEQLKELQKEEYASLWADVIYGSSNGSTDIVEVAKKQVGNIGGEPYWSWYGFKNRVEWCACFVSWCANECGYIEKGIIPRFSGVNSEGIPFFKTTGLWQDKSYIPKGRRYNIFRLGS